MMLDFLDEDYRWRYLGDRQIHKKVFRGRMVIRFWRSIRLFPDSLAGVARKDRRHAAVARILDPTAPATRG